jgi:WhiB family redox-sensing transcriptional regulator
VTECQHCGDWREEALCAQSGIPDVWFPPPGGGSPIVRIAKRICRECPVRQPCLDEALDRNEIHGIWGGLTSRERHEMRRHRPLRGHRQTIDGGLG